MGLHCGKPCQAPADVGLGGLNMKQTITVDVQRCDFCDSKDQTWNKCLRCGKDLCCTCRKRYARDRC